MDNMSAISSSAGEWVKLLLGIAGSWLVAAFVAYRKSAKQEGKDEVKEAQVRKDISDLKRTVLQSEKELADKVSLSLFKEEIAEIHGRISTTQKAQAEAMKDQGNKIDNIDRGLAELKGMVRMLPGVMAGHDKGGNL